MPGVGAVGGGWDGAGVARDLGGGDGGRRDGVAGGSGGQTEEGRFQAGAESGGESGGELGKPRGAGLGLARPSVQERRGWQRS